MKDLDPKVREMLNDALDQAKRDGMLALEGDDEVFINLAYRISEYYEQEMGKIVEHTVRKMAPPGPFTGYDTYIRGNAERCLTTYRQEKGGVK